VQVLRLASPVLQQQALQQQALQQQAQQQQALFERSPAPRPKGTTQLQKGKTPEPHAWQALS